MKIKIVVGNRPQFVKAAPLHRTFAKNSSLTVQLVHTGQHYDHNMSTIFFEEMELPAPDWYLGICEPTHGKMTGRMLGAIEELLLESPTDILIVLGDTNSTLAAGLAAAKLNISVAHIEAGLRSFNQRMPEEINRVLTDHVSDLLFTPTLGATEQLIKEGISVQKIHQVGDLMFDAYLLFSKKAEQKSKILQMLSLKPKSYVLATIHRQENTNEKRRMEEIIQGLICIAKEMPVILPMHPGTKKKVEKYQISLESKNLHVLDPIGYLDMLQLECGAKAILTDSGGVQKEAFFAKVPCITLREETEWTELVTMGYNTLAPIDAKSIERALCATQSLDVDWTKKLYGDGKTSQRILHVLTHLI